MRRVVEYDHNGGCLPQFQFLNPVHHPPQGPLSEAVEQNHVVFVKAIEAAQAAQVSKKRFFMAAANRFTSAPMIKPTAKDDRLGVASERECPIDSQFARQIG